MLMLPKIIHTFWGFAPHPLLICTIYKNIRFGTDRLPYQFYLSCLHGRTVMTKTFLIWIFWCIETFVVGEGRLTIQSIYFPFWFWSCLGNKVICLTVVQVFLIAHFCPYFQASFNAIWRELFNFEHWGGKCVRKWNADTCYLTWHCLHGVRGEGVQLTFIHTLGNCPVLSLLSKNTFKIK